MKRPAYVPYHDRPAIDLLCRPDYINMVQAGWGFEHSHKVMPDFDLLMGPTELFWPAKRWCRTIKGYREKVPATGLKDHAIQKMTALFLDMGGKPIAPGQHIIYHDRNSEQMEFDALHHKSELKFWARGSYDYAWGFRLMEHKKTLSIHGVREDVAFFNPRDLPNTEAFGSGLLVVRLPNIHALRS